LVPPGFGCPRFCPPCPAWPGFGRLARNAAPRISAARRARRAPLRSVCPAGPWFLPACGVFRRTPPLFMRPAPAPASPLPSPHRDRPHARRGAPGVAAAPGAAGPVSSPGWFWLGLLGFPLAGLPRASPVLGAACLCSPLFTPVRSWPLGAAVVGLCLWLFSCVALGRSPPPALLPLRAPLLAAWLFRAPLWAVLPPPLFFVGVLLGCFFLLPRPLVARPSPRFPSLLSALVSVTFCCFRSPLSVLVPFFCVLGPAWRRSSWASSAFFRP